MTHDSGDSGHATSDTGATSHVEDYSHDHQHDDSHNHHDDSHHHHHHDDQDNYVQNPPSYGSINAPITRYTARRWDTYSSNATNATTETNEEEEARDRKIQNCVKVVFGLLFIGVLVCVFMAYQEGHGPGYGGYPPEWVE